MGKGRRNKQEGARRSGRNRTPISGHTHIGTELVPPFLKLKNLTPSSWKDDRLPEMIWAALIRTAIPREEALDEFRRLLKFIASDKRKEMLRDITLSGIASVEDSLRREFLTFLLQSERVAQSLSTLRLFNTLPARETWVELLPRSEASVELLMRATGSHLWHQSQEATDCRWLRLMAIILTGGLQVSAQQMEEFVGYPDVGEQRSVRPSIRALEISFPLKGGEWARTFWEEAWRNTPCLELLRTDTQSIQEISHGITPDQISDVASRLQEHWSHTHVTTAIDAKHDAVFGMAFYVLRLLRELVVSQNGTSLLARLGLRTILEVHISLRFLLRKNDAELWKKWRTFGAGQAKLNALRFDEPVDLPKYIKIESIEGIASEDIWEELLKINIGSWSGLDLRRLSEQSGLKSVYDRYYSWTSGYVHGTWGPIRESSFVTCGNPLHRLHRYPEEQSLPNAVEDGATLVNEILGDVSDAYPVFEDRVVSKGYDSTRPHQQEETAKDQPSSTDDCETPKNPAGEP